MSIENHIPKVVPTGWVRRELHPKSPASMHGNYASYGRVVDGLSLLISLETDGRARIHLSISHPLRTVTAEEARDVVRNFYGEDSKFATNAEEFESGCWAAHAGLGLIGTGRVSHMIKYTA